MRHAETAENGKIAGKNEFDEVIVVPSMYKKVRSAMIASAAARSAEHGVHYDDILAATEDLLKRFANPHLHDTVTRVGRDVLRKLAKGDRLIGAALLCEKHGLENTNILRIASAATLFPAETDEFAAKLQEMIKADGINKALANATGLEADSPMIKSIVTMRRNMM